MPSRLFLFFFGAACATAQTSPLALDDAIRLAWANDPSVAALALTPELARAREEQAGIRPNPELEFRGAVPAKGDSEWALGVGLNQRLPRGDRIEQARALARLGGATAELHLREQRRHVAGEVRRLYYDVAIQQTRRDIARRTRDVQRELRASLEQRRAAGEIAATDIDLLAFEVTRAEQALAFADADLAALTQKLRGRLRVPSDTPLALNANLDVILSRPIPGDPAALETSRPTLALAAHNVRVAEAALSLARAESRGDWTVGGGVDFERRANDFTRKLENEPRLSVSASVPWPRGVANRGDIREKQAAVKIAEAELAALRNELGTEIAAAAATARALQPVLAAHHASLAPGTGIPESLRAAYDRGEITSLQLVQVRQQRFALENDFLNAAARYAAALAEAETAAGLVPAHP
jgi:cobalt-zinc-cadmium efflux system outer membrane protein